MSKSTLAPAVDGEKDAVARLLAESHFRVDPANRRIVRLVDPQRESEPDEPIKLLEVNEETIATGIQPVYFGPHVPSGVTFPSLIVEIRPEEFEQIEMGALALPHGWVQAEEFARPRD